MLANGNKLIKRVIVGFCCIVIVQVTFSKAVEAGATTPRPLGSNSDPCVAFDGKELDIPGVMYGWTRDARVHPDRVMDGTTPPPPNEIFKSRESQGKWVAHSNRDGTLTMVLKEFPKSYILSKTVMPEFQEKLASAISNNRPLDPLEKNMSQMFSGEYGELDRFMNELGYGFPISTFDGKVLEIDKSGTPERYTARTYIETSVWGIPTKVPGLGGIVNVKVSNMSLEPLPPHSEMTGIKINAPQQSRLRIKRNKEYIEWNYTISNSEKIVVPFDVWTLGGAALTAIDDNLWNKHTISFNLYPFEVSLTIKCK